MKKRMYIFFNRYHSSIERNRTLYFVIFIVMTLTFASFDSSPISGSSSTSYNTVSVAKALSYKATSTSQYLFCRTQLYGTNTSGKSVSDYDQGNAIYAGTVYSATSNLYGIATPGTGYANAFSTAGRSTTYIK